MLTAKDPEDDNIMLVSGVVGPAGDGTDSFSGQDDYGCYRQDLQ
jgi:hypothetical protein